MLQLKEQISSYSCCYDVYMVLLFV